MLRVLTEGVSVLLISRCMCYMFRCPTPNFRLWIFVRIQLLSAHVLRVGNLGLRLVRVFPQKCVVYAVTHSATSQDDWRFLVGIVHVCCLRCVLDSVITTLVLIYLAR